MNTNVRVARSVLTRAPYKMCHNSISKGPSAYVGRPSLPIPTYGCLPLLHVPTVSGRALAKHKRRQKGKANARKGSGCCRQLQQLRNVRGIPRNVPRSCKAVSKVKQQGPTAGSQGPPFQVNQFCRMTMPSATTAPDGRVCARACVRACVRAW